MGKKTYGYVRVSSRDQNIDRQIVAMEKIPIRKEDIYIDRQSGKDFFCQALRQSWPRR